MIKHTQAIRQLLPTDSLSVFDYFVGLVLKRSTHFMSLVSFLPKEKVNQESDQLHEMGWGNEAWNFFLVVHISLNNTWVSFQRLGIFSLSVM